MEKISPPSTIEAALLENTGLRFFFSLASVLLFVAVLLLFFGVGRTLFPAKAVYLPGDIKVDFHPVRVDSVKDLELALKDYGLWNLDGQLAVTPVAFERYPVGLHSRSLGNRKKIFFHTLLPVVLIAQEEVSRERQLLLDIVGRLVRLGHRLEEIHFDEARGRWQADLSSYHVRAAFGLSKKYKTASAEKLIRRVGGIPVSMALAQAAIESAWGSSRFALSGNNVFGIWTWGDNGLVPSQREDGESHKVAVFRSLLDSVRAYTLMINRVPAYAKFRALRQTTSDPLKLAEGLINYSSRRNLYVMDVKRVIELNQLSAYDAYQLDDFTPAGSYPSGF